MSEEQIKEIIAESLGDLRYCNRVWSAWNIGTMTQDDFSMAGDDSDIIGHIYQTLKEAGVFK